MRDKDQTHSKNSLKYMNRVAHILWPYTKNFKKPLFCQYFMKSYQELSVGLHSSVSLFVFQQTMIGCWVQSDDCNRRGKSWRNAVQPLCLSYSLILLTLSLCCVRQDKQAGHSCLIRHQPTAAFPGRESHKQIQTWRTKSLSLRGDLDGTPLHFLKGCFFSNSHSMCVCGGVYWFNGMSENAEPIAER